MNIEWELRGFSQKEFISAWTSSTTLAEVLKRLGRGSSSGGGSYRSIKNVAKQLGLTADHMVRQEATGHSNKAKPLADLLAEDTIITNNSRFRERLIREGYLRKECYECGIVLWRGQQAPLDLDHINGDRYDNRIENLRLLCKNCHAQTPTYGSKNRGRWSKPLPEHLKKSRTHAKPCLDCSTMVEYGVRCPDCDRKSRPTKIEWPSIEYLESKASEIGFRALGRELGVSDNAIRKRIKNYKTTE